MLGTEKQWRTIYYIYGVGMPLIFLIILLTAEHAPGNHIRPNMGESKCWFDGKQHKKKQITNETDIYCCF